MEALDISKMGAKEFSSGTFGGWHAFQDHKLQEQNKDRLQVVRESKDSEGSKATAAFPGSTKNSDSLLPFSLRNTEGPNARPEMDQRRFPVYNANSSTSPSNMKAENPGSGSRKTNTFKD